MIACQQIMKVEEGELSAQAAAAVNAKTPPAPQQPQ